MNGYMLRYFPADRLGVKVEDLNRDEDGQLSADGRQMLKSALKKTRFAYAKPGVRLESDTRIIVDRRGTLVLRSNLRLDPRSGAFGIEHEEIGEGDLHTRVSIRVWLELTRPHHEAGLLCGRISLEDSDIDASAVIMCDPSKDNRYRMSIEVDSPSMRFARELLIKILEGEAKPEKPWLF